MSLVFSCVATAGAWGGVGLGAAGGACVQPAADGSRARFDAERKACRAGLTGKDTQTCLTEAHNAYGERRRGADLQVSPEELLYNRLRRCEVHQGPERTDCEARMRGQGQTSGSVDGGGLLRELTTVVPPRQ